MMTTYTQNILEAPDDELVCYCGQVSKARIRQAVELGAHTLPALIKAVGACIEPRCEENNPRGRCCCTELAALLKAYAPQRPHDDPLRNLDGRKPKGPIIG